MAILPSLYIISLIGAQSQNYQKCCPQRRCLFWTISHLPHAVSPTNKLYLLSKSVHDRDINAKGLNRAPFLLRSKNSPVSRKSLNARCDYSSSAGFTRIKSIPSAIHSVLSKVCLLVSNISKTCEDVTPFFFFE